MTTEKRPGMSRRQVLTTAAVGVPAMGVLAATNMLGATPANAAPLATDGWWGSDTTMALQRHFGLSQTGWVDSQPASQADSNPALAGGWDWQPDGSAGGSTTISALQKMVGAGVDGLIGPATISALQARYGVAQDGVLDGPSPDHPETPGRTERCQRLRRLTALPTSGPFPRLGPSPRRCVEGPRHMQSVNAPFPRMWWGRGRISGRRCDAVLA